MEAKIFKIFKKIQEKKAPKSDISKSEMLKSQKQSKLDDLSLQQEFSIDQILKMDNA